MSEQKERSTWWRGLMMSFLNALMKIGFGAIPLIGPAAAKYSARFRYKLTGAIGDKIFEGKKCPWCSGLLVPRKGPYSQFIGCSNYPKCRYKRNN